MCERIEISLLLYLGGRAPRLAFTYNVFSRLLSRGYSRQYCRRVLSPRVDRNFPQARPSWFRISNVTVREKIFFRSSPRGLLFNYSLSLYISIKPAPSIQHFILGPNFSLMGSCNFRRSYPKISNLRRSIFNSNFHWLMRQFLSSKASDIFFPIYEPWRF